MSRENEPYRYRAKEGDLVRFPDGRLGTIVAIDIHIAACSVSVKVKPSGWRLPRLAQRLVGGLWLYDGEIDELELICAAEELEEIGT